jgi:hypothetical protein
MKNADSKITFIINACFYRYGPTTDLAVFNIFLRTLGTINEQINSLAAIRANHVSLN